MADDLVVELRESHGPDRCRRSLKCLEFHDPTVGDLGGHYNACCCQPCLYLRPFDHMWDHDDCEWYVCCNCVPRLIYARFIPDDPGEDCCVTAGTPLFHFRSVSEHEPRRHHEYYSIYVGELFSIRIEVRLGTICEEIFNPYDPYGELEPEYDCVCAWQVRMTRMGHPFLPDVSHFETIEIDHEDVTCLSPPNVLISVEGEPFAGPQGCPGRLSLESVRTAMLPYMERASVAWFMAVRPPEAHSECDPEYDPYDGHLVDKVHCDPMFIDLDPPCGWAAVQVDGIRWREEDWGSGKRWCSPVGLETEGLCVYWSAYYERWVIGPEAQQPEAYGPRDYAEGAPYGKYYTDPDCEEPGAYCDATTVEEDPYLQCTQVCSRLSERRYGRPEPWHCVEWRWFDNSFISPYTGEWVLQRGWYNMDPRGRTDEILWLEEDDQGRCQLVPEFEYAGSLFLPRILSTAWSSGCSCALAETLLCPPFPKAWSHFRCGFCACWRHYCGTCRCVPAELCVQWFDGWTLYTNIILSWDSEQYKWRADGEPVSIALVRSDKPESAGECLLVPDLPIEWIRYGDGYQIHRCGDGFTDEFAGHKVFDPDIHVINLHLEGWRQSAWGLRDVWIMADSLVPYCDPGPCLLLGCHDYCRSNPGVLKATIEIYWYYYAYPDPVECPGCPGYITYDGWCSQVLNIHYHQMVGGPIAPGDKPQIHCGYIGMKAVACMDAAVLHLEYSHGEVRLMWDHPEKELQGNTFQTTTQSCDPVYVLTDEDEDPITFTEEGFEENWPRLNLIDLDTEECFGCPWDAIKLVRVVLTE